MRKIVYHEEHYLSKAYRWVTAIEIIFLTILYFFDPNWAKKQKRITKDTEQKNIYLQSVVKMLQAENAQLV